VVLKGQASDIMQNALQLFSNKDMNAQITIKEKQRVGGSNKFFTYVSLSLLRFCNDEVLYDHFQ
jgi:hypothetical protein